ncbi:MAG: iron ABC transporter permease [Acidimicrobiia bacterium]|nr:iron ABC transporter permease [Acidimicrobiia bacterium]NNF87293.1 iron ABC transporter permease [Acidimicrobiia bacterium]NNJ47566.1 iron ABC transporter permease [Acidimicrobiia bacterium]NNL13850.1 iron ABC transporter permease [Acidimicrobiia bacterium]
MVSKPPSPVRRSGLSAVTAIIGLLFLFPAGYLVVRTLSLGADFSSILLSEGALRPLANSLLIATATALLAGILGTTLAVLVARTDLPGRSVWRWALALPLVIPSFVGATAVLAAFGDGALVEFVPRLGGFWGALAVLTLLTYPYVYLPVQARLSSTAPSIEDAARLLGDSSWRAVRKIVLPQIRPSILAGSLLVFLYGLSDFGAVSLMRFDTITRVIFSTQLSDRATSLTLGLLLALVALLVAAADRSLAGRRPTTGSIGRRQVEYPLGRLAWPALALTGLVMALALATPILVFVVWVVRGSSTVGIGYSGLGDSLGFLVEPTVSSAGAAALAALVAVVVIVPVAYASARRRSWVSESAGAAITSVFALPGLVVALSLAFWAIRAPGALGALYQTMPLLVLGYILHFGAQALGPAQAAIASVPARLDEAARTMGAGARRRFVTVELPLIAPGLMAGAGLVLLSTLKELPATLILAPIGFETLATRIWTAAEDGFFAEVGITSLVLVGLSGLLTWPLLISRALRE